MLREVKKLTGIIIVSSIIIATIVIKAMYLLVEVLKFIFLANIA